MRKIGTRTSQALGMAIGGGLLLLIYGRKEYKKRWIDNKEALTGPAQLSLALGAVWWVISAVLLFSGVANKDTVSCIIYMIGFPLALVIWSICVRRRGEKDESISDDG